MLALEHNITARLSANGLASLETGERDRNFPVLRIVADTGESWTISESKPDDRDLAYAVYDAGDGSIPSIGWVSLAELSFARSARGRLLDIDRRFRPTRPLGEYYPEIRLSHSLPSRPTRH